MSIIMEPVQPPQGCTTAEALARKHAADVSYTESRCAAMLRPRPGQRPGTIPSASQQLQAAGLRAEMERQHAEERAQLEAYLAFVASGAGAVGDEPAGATATSAAAGSGEVAAEDDGADEEEEEEEEEEAAAAATAAAAAEGATGPKKTKAMKRRVRT
ncbi:MAG: hypothetical protein EOO41_00240 [Methanobacteriota archaeon]|nr:MAG: hypothetical protein EOO41_00240 [Euryarchaeota archaeon]